MYLVSIVWCIYYSNIVKVGISWNPWNVQQIRESPKHWESPFKALASVCLILFLAIAAFTVEETLPTRRCKPDIMSKCDCTFCIGIRSRHLRVSGQKGHTDSVNTLCLKYQVSLQPCTCRVHNSNYVSWVTSSSIKHRNEVSNITSNFFCLQVNTGTLDHPLCLWKLGCTCSLTLTGYLSYSLVNCCLTLGGRIIKLLYWTILSWTWRLCGYRLRRWETEYG